MRRLFTLTVPFVLLAGLTLLMTGCPEGVCRDEVKRKSLYTYTSAFAYNLDNSGQDAVISVGDSILRNAFGLRLVFTIKSLDSVAAPVTSGCLYTTWVARDSLASLKITAAEDFDDQHPAGSDLTDLFKFYVRDDVPYVAVKDFIKNDHGNYSYYDDFISDTRSLELYLLTPPPAKGIKNFKIDVTLTNQTVLSITPEGALLK